MGSEDWGFQHAASQPFGAQPAGSQPIAVQLDVLSAFWCSLPLGLVDHMHLEALEANSSLARCSFLTVLVQDLCYSDPLSSVSTISDPTEGRDDLSPHCSICELVHVSTCLDECLAAIRRIGLSKDQPAADNISMLRWMQGWIQAYWRWMYGWMQD